MERAFVEELRRQLPPHPQLLLGVGDDAAILRMAQRSDCVVTSDLLADGTHFRLPSDDLRRVGQVIPVIVEVPPFTRFETLAENHAGVGAK